MTIEVPEATSRRLRTKTTPGNQHRADGGPTASDFAARPTPARIAGRRNPKWIALGVVALCLGALLSYVIYARVADQAAVVAVAHTLRRGSTIQAADLTTVKIASGSGLRTVPASDLERLVGQQAVFDLVAGSILPVGAVGEVLVPGTGRAVVGVRLVSGRAPVGLLVRGAPVRLIAIPPAGSDPEFSDDYTGRTIFARVLSQTDGPDGTSTVINVDVPASQAPAVALLAAQERLAVVRDADK